MTAYKFAWALKLFQACNAEMSAASDARERTPKTPVKSSTCRAKTKQKARHEIIRVGLCIW
jgi:hypothetical protein